MLDQPAGTFTSETTVDDRGILVNETTFESEDETFGFSFTTTPVEVYKVDLLTNLCRLRYSQAKGVLCTEPTAPGPEKCSDPIIQNMTGLEYQEVVEKDEIEHIKWQFEKHPDKITDKVEYPIVINKQLGAIKAVHSGNFDNDKLSEILLEAINVGNAYLEKSGVKHSGELSMDWIVRQPII